MKSYEVLELAIPRASSERIAQRLNISADYVRRWRREPESEDSPSGTGQRSILDRICDLMDFVFLENPHGTGLIVNYINAHFNDLIKLHVRPIDGSVAKAELVSDLLTQATEGINKFNLQGCTRDTVRELVEARDAFSRAVQMVEKTMQSDEGDLF